MKKYLFAAAAVIVSIALFFLIKSIWPESTPVPPTNIIGSADQVKGERDAKTTLIEYSDFQCPACRAYWPLVKQAAQEFPDQIAIVYRHFPLAQHKNAKGAAQASEAAARQGKFWEMHNLLFENQKEWEQKPNPQELFEKYAQDAGLDLEKFKSDLASREIEEKVQTDYRSGLAASVNSTPTFFLNGQKLETPKSYEEFKKIIEDATKNQL